MQDECIFCHRCWMPVVDYCTFHGHTLIIPDTEVSKSPLPRPLPQAALTIPNKFLHYGLSFMRGSLGVFSSTTIPPHVRFGPYRGVQTQKVASRYCWQVYFNDNTGYVIDAVDENYSNWMRYINRTPNLEEQNLVAYQHKGQIYYRSVKVIPSKTELLVFYGCEYVHLLETVNKRIS